MEKFFCELTNTWWGITILCVVGAAVWILLSAALYRQFFKRFYDFILSLIAIVLLSPLLLILTIVGAIAMRGNPFFTQLRPGKKDKNGNEKIFRLIKFRTMSNKKDADGNLLPDAQRLNKYGKFLRKSSLDELGELVNILKGDMSIVGPRPLLVKYLPWYTETERHRHDVCPGLTGWAQVNGRNFISWEETFALDLYYVSKVSFLLDIKIIFFTIKKVVRRADITDATQGVNDSSGKKVHDALDVERRDADVK